MIAAPDDPAGLRYAAGIDRQAGVLAYRPTRAGPRMVLVTSRRTGRWVLPKGTIDDGMTPEATARQEALEEAGVIGRPAPRALGTYRVPKIRPPLIWTVEVLLYPMPIERVLDHWLEAGERDRRFVAPDEALALLDDPGMAGLVRAFWTGRAARRTG